jgi:hypothetical protein
MRNVAIFPESGKLAPMKTIYLAVLLALSAAFLAAQTPVSPAAQAPVSPATQTHSDPVGYSYTLPADWQMLDMQPALPALRQQFEKDATTEVEKKGLECVQVAFTARRGDPPSVILAVTYSFDCVGMTMKDSDLPAFAMGTAAGLKKTWNIVDPYYGAYMLGSHSMWIERAKGNPIDHPETQKTLEVVCGILKKGAVCWMAFAVDDASLKTFEQAPVVFDGDAHAALVPHDALTKKP